MKGSTGFCLYITQREVWRRVDMHNPLPVLRRQLVEEIQEMLEQKLTQTIINGYLRGRGSRPHNDLHLFGHTVCPPRWVAPRSCGSKRPGGMMV